MSVAAWHHEEERILQFWHEETGGSIYQIDSATEEQRECFFLKCRRRYLASGPDKRDLFVQALNYLFRATALERIGSRMKAEIEVMP